MRCFCLADDGEFESDDTDEAYSAASNSSSPATTTPGAPVGTVLPKTQSDHDAASFPRHQAKQQAKIKRAARMQNVKNKRSSGQTAALVEWKMYKPNNRGGKNTQSRCSKCGMLKQGTHPKSGCPN